jgi:riboflavin synthase
MFTGIVTGVGRIVAAAPLGSSLQHGQRLTIAAPANYLNDVQPGDSIAINGACMTVTLLDVATQQFNIDISAESLSKTTGLTESSSVNLEKALRAQDGMGGHIVSGHVDGIGQVNYISQVGESWELRIGCAASLGKYLAYKGSITINGVSLTINHVTDSSQICEVSMNLIPHTVENTALRSLQVGSAVNVEIDLIARYVERMLGMKNI